MLSGSSVGRDLSSRAVGLAVVILARGGIVVLRLYVFWPGYRGSRGSRGRRELLS